MEMGFSKDVSEKALFLCLSKPGEPLSNALEWISDNSEQPDFNEPLIIVGYDNSWLTHIIIAKMTQQVPIQRAPSLRKRSSRRPRSCKRLFERREKKRRRDWQRSRKRTESSSPRR